MLQEQNYIWRNSTAVCISRNHRAAPADYPLTLFWTDSCKNWFLSTDTFTAQKEGKHWCYPLWLSCSISLHCKLACHPWVDEHLLLPSDNQKEMAPTWNPSCELRNCSSAFQIFSFGSLSTTNGGKASISVAGIFWICATHTKAI